MRRHSIVVLAASAMLLAGCKQKVNPADAANHLKAAQDLYASKDYPKAAIEIQTAIKADPRNSESHYLAAEIQQALGNQQGAIEEFARAATPELNNLKAQLKFSEILIDARQFDPAIGRINGTLGSHPNDPDALALRAMAYQRAGNAEKARSDAQTALARVPGQTNASAVMAIDALTAQNADKALAVLAPALKAKPDSVVLLRLKAAALILQNKKDEAVTIYQGLVKARPEDLGLRVGLAELDASTGQVDAGEKVLRDGVAAKASSRDARIALITFLAKARGQAAADAETASAIADNPQDSAFDLLRAEQQLRAQHPEEASKTLQAAVARVPDGQARATAQIALARIDLAQGNAADARKLLDQVLTAKPDNDEALLMRAGMMIAAGDAEHATPDLLAVAGRNPRSPTPMLLLADAYTRQNDLDKAVDAMKKVVYFDPANIQPVIGLAKLQMQQKKPADAKQTVADFTRRNPENVEGFIAQVRLALEQKDWGAAQTAIDSMRRAPKSDRPVALLSAELSDAKGNSADAVALYAKLLEPGRPLDRDALTGFARSSVAAKQTDQAIRTLTALAAQKTGDEAMAVNLALSSLYRVARKIDESDRAIQAATSAAPNQPAPYIEAARVAGLDQPDKGIAALNAGLAAGATQEPLLIARGDLEDASGQRDAAIATYLSVMKMNPRSVVAANNYASLVADANPHDKAVLTNAREPILKFADAANPAVLDTLAWLDYRLGDYQSAKALLTRAKADSSKNPQLRFHYGAVLIALGDKDAGRSILRDAIGETFPGRDEARKMLSQ